MGLIRKILIVDDAPMFRELESLFLARLGRVFTAANGEEALEIARRELPDVVVTDLWMPGMEGDELCRQIRQDPTLQDTPVIVVTSVSDGEEHARAVRAGAVDVLEKPINRLTLIQAVNRLLRRVRYHGLVRVDMETDVHFGYDHKEGWGWARNVSRGGMFLETETLVELETELQLEFLLPDAPYPLRPTAKVVWQRTAIPPEPAGIGLQFLKLDHECARIIDDYVYERAVGLVDPLQPGQLVIAR